MKRVYVVTLLVCAALYTTGCGRLSGGSEDGQVPSQNDGITLHVINQNFYDARLYARWQNGRRVSIGYVTGFDEQDFDFRWEGFDLRVEINLLSVGVHFTTWMIVDKGDELELVIDPSLDKRIRTRSP